MLLLNKTLTQIIQNKKFPVSTKFTFNNKYFTPQDNIANAKSIIEIGVKIQWLRM